MKKDLVDIAGETLDITLNGEYDYCGTMVPIADEIDHAIDASRYYPPRLDVFGPDIKLTPIIDVTDETTTAAAKRLIEGGLTNIVALNFASASNPGGGWLHGAKAQEEDLARCSSLGYCLELHQQYYDINKDAKTSLYTDGIIYSPNVPFFRDEYLQLTEVPYLVSIITAPAPNVRGCSKKEIETIPDILFRRMCKVLEIAALHGHKEIILGAWGCGAFGNDPELVANLFKAALAKVPKFELVCFAVYDPRPGQPVLKIFENTFGKNK